MFEEDDEEYFESHLNEDLDRFEAHLKGDSIGFIDSDRLEMLIDHYLINNQYSKAKLAAEHAISHFSYNALFYLRKAQAISAMGQLKEALHILSHIDKWDLPNCEFYLTKASIFSQLRDHKNAIKFFKEALVLSEPNDRDEIYLDLAMEYENAQDFKNAVQVLKEAIACNSHNEGAIYEIAYCYDQLGEYNNAIQCYLDFIDENPYSFTAWYNLGNAYSKLENFDRAIWAYDYCVLINEEFGPVHFNLGTAHLSIDQFDLAIESFNKCMDLDGEDAMALCYIGECYEQINNLILAKFYYEKSLKLSPRLPDAWLGLGIVADLEGNTKEAISLLNKAAHLDPENAGIYHVLAGAYEKIEDLHQAEEYYQLSLALDHKDEECLTDYIMLLTKSSMKEACDYLFDFNRKIGGNKIGFILEVGLLWKLGEKTEALMLLAQCIEEDKDKCKELFQIFPELSSVEELILLTD